MWTTAYDATGNVTATADPLGHGDTLAYDLAGRLTRQADPLGHAIRYEYDLTGNVTSSTDPLDRITGYGYDALNRRTAVTDALAGVWATAYDAAGNVTARTDARGSTTRYAYDPLGRATRVTDPLNRVTPYSYDPAGNLLSQADPLGRTTQYGYDRLNRRTAVTDPAGGVWGTAYDAAGNVTASTDPLGHASTAAYDLLGRTTSTTDALNRVTRYGYDAAGNRTRLTDAAGNATTFAYDAADRLTAQTDPLGQVTAYSYDAANRLTLRTDRLGRTRSLVYDAAGRQTAETWTDAAGQPAGTLGWSYDDAGNRLSASSPAGTYSYSYDALDRVTSQAGPWGLTLSFSYDAAGNRTGVQDSRGGVETSTYDAAGQLVRRVLTSGGQTARVDQSWTAAGQLETVSRYADAAGTVLVGGTEYGYDLAGRTATITHTDGTGATVAAFAYGYDLAGRVTSETADGLTQTYAYDATDQLTAAGSEAYSYDETGNRTMAGYVVDTNNRLLSDGAWTYEYDAEGNRTGQTRLADGLSWSYGYDQRNQLTSAEQRSSDGALQLRLDYGYDADGRRIATVRQETGEPATAERVAYDGDAVWADLDGLGSLTDRYLYTQDEAPAARLSGPAVTAWLLADRLGSVRAVSDGDGAVQDRIAYSGFGQVVLETNPAWGGRYKYTGQAVDPDTGLQEHHWRWYDPATGQWTSEDPLGFAAGDPNLRRYVGNNATNATDPSGLILVATSEHLANEYAKWLRGEAGIISQAGYEGPRIAVTVRPDGAPGQFRLVIDPDDRLRTLALLDEYQRKGWRLDAERLEALLGGGRNIEIAWKRDTEGAYVGRPGGPRFDIVNRVRTDAEMIKERADAYYQDYREGKRSYLFDPACDPYAELYRTAMQDQDWRTYKDAEVAGSSRPPSGFLSSYQLYKNFGPGGRAESILVAAGAARVAVVGARAMRVPYQQSPTGPFEVISGAPTVRARTPDNPPAYDSAMPFDLHSPGNRITDPAYLLEDRSLKTPPLLEYKAPGGLNPHASVVFQHKPTSGAVITANPEKTTTLIGSYPHDLKNVLGELNYPVQQGKMANATFGGNKGGYNLLNVSEEMYLDAKAQGGFFKNVNAKWIDEAVKRRDDFIVVSDLKYMTSEGQLTGFGKEIKYLHEVHNYTYDPVTHRMVPK